MARVRVVPVNFGQVAKRCDHRTACFGSRPGSRVASGDELKGKLQLDITIQYPQPRHQREHLQRRAVAAGAPARAGACTRGGDEAQRGGVAWASTAAGTSCRRFRSTKKAPMARTPAARYASTSASGRKRVDGARVIRQRRVEIICVAGEDRRDAALDEGREGEVSSLASVGNDTPEERGADKGKFAVAGSCKETVRSAMTLARQYRWEEIFGGRCWRSVNEVCGWMSRQRELSDAFLQEFESITMPYKDEVKGKAEKGGKGQGRVDVDGDDVRSVSR
ncbi:hypothetical protein B0H14DRAFT_3176495 [Mycena olivaceomarginata]|nr:hypothetical protein B0H14DRAFT_3176495 [Mycena olivaceomarginata]